MLQIKGENHDLNIESRLDRVSLYGSVDITRDQEGLAQALRLKVVVDGMVSALSEEQGRGGVPDKVESTVVGVAGNSFDDYK